MKVYEQTNEEMGQFIIESVEKETGKSIFTFKIVKDENETLETIVVFEDKTVLMAMIEIQTIDGQYAARIRGNYI